MSNEQYRSQRWYNEPELTGSCHIGYIIRGGVEQQGLNVRGAVIQQTQL